MTEKHAISEQLTAWFIHFLTASTTVTGLFMLFAIQKQNFTLAFYFMAYAIAIDAVDGTLARRFHVKTILPKIDGALLDNIADFINYVIGPCFLLLQLPNSLPSPMGGVLISCIVLASAYQFTQSDAKTPDNFFLGFPCYWNFVVFYVFIFDLSPWITDLSLTLLIILVFVPIKYVYPSRMDHFSRTPTIRYAMLAASTAYGLANLWILIRLPHIPTIPLWFCYFFIAFYFLVSVYRTLFPLPPLNSD